MTEEHHRVYFCSEVLIPAEHVDRSLGAIADCNRRREEWLKERRQQLRERTRANVIERALKKQTERCAARKSGDPSLAVGRRLQAKIHSDLRKRGTSPQSSKQPVRGRLASIPAMSVASDAETVAPRLFDWSKFRMDKTGKWYHRGRWYTVEELRKCLQLEKRLGDSSQLRMIRRRNLRMLTVKANSKQRQVDAPRKPLLPAPKHPVKTRQPSIHEWKMSQLALEYAERDRAKRRASIRMMSICQASDFVSDFTEPTEELIEMDLNDVEFETGDDFKMPTVEEFNAQPHDTFTDVLRPFSLDFLYALKDHIKSQGLLMKVFAERTKWNILNNAIIEKKQTTHGSRRDRDGDVNISNSPYNDSTHSNMNNKDKSKGPRYDQKVKRGRSTKSDFKHEYGSMNKNLSPCKKGSQGQRKGKRKGKRENTGMKIRSSSRKVSRADIEMT